MAVSHPSRRVVLRLSAALAAGAVPARADDGSVRKSTHTYKTAGACALATDVYQPADEPKAPRPALVWIHGGALIMGSRAGIDPALRDALVRAGYVVLSIDYRLAPETKLPAILDDVRDALRWTREEGARRFAIDPARLAVAGASAGGYLTLTTGYHVSPPPRVLVSYWGYGDVAGAWSSPHTFNEEIYPQMTQINTDEMKKFCLHLC